MCHRTTPQHVLSRWMVATWVLLVLTLAACAGRAEPGADGPDEAPDPAVLDGSWELVEGTGPAGEVDQVDG